MATRTRGRAISGWFIALVVGAAASRPILRLLGLADIDDVPFVMAFTGPYIAAALFLLVHARRIRPRITISLLISLAPLVACFVYAQRLTGTEQTAAIVMAVYTSVASFPLLVVGIHNLCWALSLPAAIAPVRATPSIKL